ncbi:MAG: ABC transporter permease [Acidobacteriota bacterium]
MKASARSLTRGRAATWITLLTLALGIGGGTATFSVLDALVFRSLPYPDADQLAVVWSTDRDGATRQASPGEFDAWREQSSTVFENMAAYMFWGYTLTGHGEPAALTVAAITPELLPTLGVEPRIGRAFGDDDAVPGRGDVVLLEHDFWQRRFGGDEDVVGRTVSLDGQPHLVVGIMPPGFRFPHENVSLWVPLALNPRGPGYRRPALRVVARLEDGVTLHRAQEAMTIIAARLADERATESIGRPGDERDEVSVLSLHEQTYGRIEPMVYTAIAAVAAVFLIACANVAHLLLARAEQRRLELAVRSALGASRRQLLTASLVESLLLALGGALLGLPLAQWSLHAVARLGTGGLAWPTEPALYLPTVGVALGLACVTSLLFGLLPALRAAQQDPRGELGDGDTRSSAGRGRRWLSGGLIALEMALALFLLVASGLLLLSLDRLERISPGFEIDDLSAFRIQLPSTRYPSRARQDAFVEQLQDRLDALPGILSVGTTNTLPMNPSDRDFDLSYLVRGRSIASTDQPQAHLRLVSPSYHQTMGIPLRSGRYFDRDDAQSDRRQVIVNETMARLEWPDERAIGAILTIDWNGSHEYEVVGVVGDVRHRGPAHAPTPTMYWPIGQASSPNVSLVVRSDLPPSTLRQAITARVGELDAELPIRSFDSMAALAARSLAERRVQGRVLAALGALTLLLAAVGVYGVMSHAVGQQRREIAVRMALGARAGTVLRGVLGRALLFAGAGLAAGALAAVLVAQAIDRVWPQHLVGVSPTEPLVFGLCAGTLTLIAVVGSLLPARRAAALDPSVVLRGD